MSWADSRDQPSTLAHPPLTMPYPASVGTLTPTLLVLPSPRPRARAVFH